MVKSNFAFSVVCSAHAEMIPIQNVSGLFDGGLLRTRGDDPSLDTLHFFGHKSAPHTRR